MFFSDLHIHSKYSRATARDCDFYHLVLWGAKKGLQVIGTGDFTHPAWRDEIRTSLVPAEPGLYRLTDALEAEVARRLPKSCRASVRFVLSVEIATIYKKDQRTRKVHHLVLAPDLEAAERIVARLERIGNLHSDGRPILGLDSRDLLEIVLEADEHCCLIPAHIWTPWFSVLGSKSGFDSIEECYADLSGHIFALETGLSSDPEMNWRVSVLDKYRLVSHSDAHSPGKLAREATVFSCSKDYFAIRSALQNGHGYEGTVEFFPEEGKYHLDGHRKCAQRLTPEQTRALDGRCPVCHGRLTVGVMHRVEELADRSILQARQAPPATAAASRLLVPLAEILSEIFNVGPQSKQVMRTYTALIQQLGPELSILSEIPIEVFSPVGSPLLAEALVRLRAGRVHRQAGYDGQYGTIRLFTDAELQTGYRSVSLFTKFAARPEPQEKPRLQNKLTCDPKPREPVRVEPPPDDFQWDVEQQAVIQHTEGPLLVKAGPGSGKTRVLTERIGRLIDIGCKPETCLAVTFTRRAAEEMTQRLVARIGEAGLRVKVMTIHALGAELLQAYPTRVGLQPNFEIADDDQRCRLLIESCGLSRAQANQWLKKSSEAKQAGGSLGFKVQQQLNDYRAAMKAENWADFDDLILLSADLLGSDPEVAAYYKDTFRYVSVDEYQDLDAHQARLIKNLVGREPNLCAIGDPDQSIYAFRGADPTLFDRFEKDFPGAKTICLRHNYRSSPTIVGGACQVISQSDGREPQVASRWIDPYMISLHTAPTGRSEAEFVVQQVEKLIGGHSFFSIDSGRAADGRVSELSFSDFAVLYRTDEQAGPLVEALDRSGIPFQKRSHNRMHKNPVVRAISDMLRQNPQNPASMPVKERLQHWAQVLTAGDDPPFGEWDIQDGLVMLNRLAERCGQDEKRLHFELALGQDADAFAPLADRLTLLTLHAAKGLEFEVVFIVGCEDGILPLRFFASGPTDLHEERRLFYVGMTRAKQKLYLLRAQNRWWRGANRRQDPSPFLADIEGRLVEIVDATMPRRKPSDTGMQLKMF